MASTTLSRKRRLRRAAKLRNGGHGRLPFSVVRRTSRTTRRRRRQRGGASEPEREYVDGVVVNVPNRGDYLTPDDVATPKFA